MEEVLGVVVREEAEVVVEAVVVAKTKVARIRVRVRTDKVLGQVNAGPTSRRVLTTRRQGSVKNIMSMGNLHTGVRSRAPALGRISGFPKASIETVTNLILMTYKTHCIKVST